MRKNTFHRIKSLVENKSFIFSLVIITVVLTSLQSLNMPKKVHKGQSFTSYNNYIIFKSSFNHLKGDQVLYNYHYPEHIDLFKYTPTFAAFFGLFTIFPDWAGLVIWNLLNALILAASIYYLPYLSKFEKGFVIMLLLVELITHLQNEQSNALIAGLIIFSFGLMERKKLFTAALLIALSVYIKVFGVLALLLFIFYPDKWKAAFYSIFWMIVLFAAPLVFISPAEYFDLLADLFQLIRTDHASSYGISVMGVVHTWFGLNYEKLWVLIPGLILLLIPLIKTTNYKYHEFRLLMLSALLIWMVIFNHKAESPTFILAMTGVAIWFVKAEKNVLNISLLLFAIIFTSLSPTDIFPAYVRSHIFKAYALKALPCIIIWFKIVFDMLSFNCENIPDFKNNRIAKGI